MAESEIRRFQQVVLIPDQDCVREHGSHLSKFVNAYRLKTIDVFGTLECKLNYIAPESKVTADLRSDCGREAL